MEAEGFGIARVGFPDFFGESGEGGVEGDIVKVLQCCDFVGHFPFRVNEMGTSRIFCG